MTDLNKLADELEGLAKDADKGSWDDRAKANASLRNALIVNIPTILSALRDAGKMREAAAQFRDAVSAPIPTGPDYYAWVAQGREAREKLDAALKTEGE
jgi:hypothetical protein